MSEPYRRFMLLSSPRCGTHMLVSALAQHPAIVALSEVFNPDWTRNAPFGETTPEAEILAEHVFCRYPDDVRAVGFALHRSGARFGRWPTLWQRLEADRDLHVVSLARLHLLGRYLSYRVMREKPGSGEHLVITPAELEAELRIQETTVSAFDKRFASHPFLSVKYEELTGDAGPVLRRLQEFLGVDPLPLEPRTPRNEAVAYRDRIANYDELAAHFAGTRWGWFFIGGVPPR